MLKTLILTRMKFMLSSMSGNSGRKKNSLGMKILFALLIVYGFGAITVMFFGLYSQFCPIFKQLDLMWFYFAIMGIMTLSLCFIGSVFGTQTQIFEAKDNELLLSMPIPPRYILLSRLLMLLIFNYAYAALTSFPAIIIYFINFGFSAGALVAFLIQYLTLPLFALALSCVCGWLIALINSRLRSKNIMPIVLSVTFLAAYFFFIGRANTLIAELVTNSEKIAEGLKAVFVIYAYGESIASFNIPYLVLTAALFIIPMAVIYAVLSATFIRIATRQKGNKKTAYREKTLRGGSAFSALTMKEMKHVFGSAVYFMNGACGEIMLLIGVVMLIVKRADITQILTQLPGIEALYMPLAVACISGVNSMTMISPSSISLEGKTLWLIKSFPVEPGTVLLSKAMCQFIITLVPTLIASVAAAALFPMSIADSLLTVLAPQIFNAFFAVLGVFINLQLPKFDWVSEVVVIKQGISSMLSMLFNMISIVTPALIFGILLMPVMSGTVFVAAVSALFVLACAFLCSYFYKGGAKRFEQLG